VKIILVLVAVVVLMGAMGVAGVMYLGYRARQKITELKREYGVSPETTRSAAERARSFAPSKGSGCRMLEGQEAAGILGAAVDRVESTTDRSDASEWCRYWITAAERKRLVRAEIASGIDAVGKSDKDSTAGAEKLIGGALASVIEASGDNKNEDCAFQVQVWRSNGRAMWDKMESAKASAKSMAGGVDLVGMATSPVDGVGERAMVLPGGHSIMVQKGDAFFVLGFQQFVPGREKTIRLAKSIADRM
jgi:hypothetical protein